MLSADEERALAERPHYRGDLEAAKTLIPSHLRFVVHIARNYAGWRFAAVFIQKATSA